MSNLSFKEKALFATFIGIGGVIGTLIRFLVSLLFKGNSKEFPWDTIIVNLSGSFLLAFLLSVTIYHIQINKLILTFFTTGVLGSFTTLSTIMIDLNTLYNLSTISTFIYLSITIIGGFLLALIGFILGKGFD